MQERSLPLTNVVHTQTHVHTHACRHCSLKNGLKSETVAGDAGDIVPESLEYTALGLSIKE